MDEEEILVKILEIHTNKLDTFHNALSDSEKHFTWWILAILGFIVVAFTIQYAQRPYVLLFLSFAGIFVSLTGYFVVRKEGRYFVENKERFKRIANALEVNEELWNIPGADSEKGAKYVTLEPAGNSGKKYTGTWEHEEGANKSFLALIYFSVMSIYSALMRAASSTGLRKSKADAMKRENSLNIRDYFQVLYLMFAVVFLGLIAIY